MLYLYVAYSVYPIVVAIATACYCYVHWQCTIAVESFQGGPAGSAAKQTMQQTAQLAVQKAAALGEAMGLGSGTRVPLVSAQMSQIIYIYYIIGCALGSRTASA